MLSNLRRLIYLGGIYSIGSLFERSLSFFFIPIYTTYLGTLEYGIIGLMSVTVGLISKFVLPPVMSGFVRYYYAPEYEDKKGLLLFNSFLFLAAQCLILSFLLYLMKMTVAFKVLKDPDLVRIVEIYAFILFFQPLANFLLTFLRQEEKAKLVIMISWARFLVSATFILFALIQLNLGVYALVYGNLLGSLFTVVCVFPVFWKYATPKISYSVLGPPLRFGYPLLLQGFSILLIQSGDRFVLQFFSSLSVVGLYTFGYKFAEIINTLLVIPLKHALQPVVLKQEGEPESLKAFVRKNCTYFYFVGMFLCLFLSLFSKEMVILMARRDEFLRSWIIVPIIAFSYLQHGLGNFFNWGLAMAKKGYHISANVLISAVVNLGLNFVLVPYWGILGAAVATLVSYIVWNSLKIYYSAKFYDLHFELRRLGQVTVVGFTLYWLSLVLANTNSISLNLTIKSLVLIMYPVIFFLTGFFSITEKEYMVGLWSYLRQNGLAQTYSKIKGLESLSDLYS